MVDPNNPFRGGQKRMFTAQVIASDSVAISPSMRKDENGRGLLVDTGAGTFNFEVQARVDADSPWVPIPVTLGDGPNINNKVVVITAADLNASDRIPFTHDLWPEMRHSCNTMAATPSLDSWIIL